MFAMHFGISARAGKRSLTAKNKAANIAKTATITKISRRVKACIRLSRRLPSENGTKGKASYCTTPFGRALVTEEAVIDVRTPRKRNSVTGKLPGALVIEAVVT